MMSQEIEPAELWIVAPPSIPAELRMAVAYLVYAGVDIAFGPNDTLAEEPPESLDGVRVILVTYDDVERVRQKLRGFRGFRTEGTTFFDPDTSIYCMGQVLKGGFGHSRSSRSPDAAGQNLSHDEKFRRGFVMTFLHDNGKTWLAVYGREALTLPNRLESPLLLTGDLTLQSPSFRSRMLARPDEQIRRQMMETVRRSDRTDWGDIPYNLGKALLDDYEATGDRASLDHAIHFTDVMLAETPASWYGHFIMPMVTIARLHAITGDERYRRLAHEAMADVTTWPEFRAPARGWCHATMAMSPETRAFLTADAGDMGSYGELMATAYLPVMATAKLMDNEREIADLVARCVREQRRNLRDPETGLYWHGIPSRHAGHEGFLGHGLGWSAFGLSQILDFFPDDDPERDGLLEIHREQADAAARVQHPEGGFHTILNWPWTHINVHYTAWLGYVFLHGARKGWLDPSYRDRGLAAWHALKMRSFWGNVACAAGGNPVSRRLPYYVEHNCRVHVETFAGRGNAAQSLFTLLEVLRLAKR